MSIKKNFFYNFLLTSSNLLFPLLTFPYLSRVIGAEGLGICNFIMSYTQNFITIAALGLSVYGIREIARVGDDTLKRSKLFFELLTIHLLFTTVLLIIYYVTVFLYADFKNYMLLSLVGGSFILLNVFTIEWLFTGVNDFKYITIRSVIIRALSVLSIFVFVKQKNDFLIYFIINIITIFLTVLINISYSRKYISRNITFSFKGMFSHLKPLVILGMYVIITSIYTSLPLTLLGFFSSKAAVGYYYGANRIIRMVISVFTVLTTVMIPKLNLEVEKKDNDNYLTLIHKSLNFVISLGLPIAFLVYLLADPLVMLLAGKNFTNSIFCVQLMAPIILIVAFAQVFCIQILSVNRKDKEMVMLSIVGMAISLLINILFITHYAERATAFSQITAELIVTVISFFLAKRAVNFSFPTKKFLLNLLFVVPFSFITYLCIKYMDKNILKLLFSGLICGLYFLFYQFVILKDKFLMGIINPYIIKFKKS